VNRKRKQQTITYRSRQWLVLGIMVVVLGLLFSRAAYLQLVATDYLQAQGSARYQRVNEIAATRGMIRDRNAEPLAVSTPVDSVWGHPPTLLGDGHSWRQIAGLLGMKEKHLLQLVRDNGDKEFLYLKRHLSPDAAQRVLNLKVAGIEIEREYRRFYPTGPVFGQILGFTNIDDRGQEGLELAFNQTLTGVPGRRRVLRDRVGHAVEHSDEMQPALPGADLYISLDARIQYLAYRHLFAAYKKHGARGATLVALDARTGEVLAMVNAPGFNPNNRTDRDGRKYRNRAVTDVFEPGSTIKPFTIATALQKKAYLPDTRVDTTPGTLQVGSHTIRDTHDYGLLTVSRVLIKSSNVGAAKIALKLPVQDLVKAFGAAGLGSATGVNFPGEVSGNLPQRVRWREIEQATLAFGYGLSVTALQLARAYTVFATDGRVLPISLRPRSGIPAGTRVFDAKVVRQVRRMLEQAASDQGTGKAAQIARYRVAGKTGTVHKVVNGQYAEDHYLSVFAGFAPASAPRIVMVVMIDDPRGKAYYGGEVAAPVFAAVMSGALRLLNVPPDQMPEPLKQAARHHNEVAQRW